MRLKPKKCFDNWLHQFGQYHLSQFSLLVSSESRVTFRDIMQKYRGVF